MLVYYTQEYISLCSVTSDNGLIFQINIEDLVFF